MKKNKQGRPSSRAQFQQEIREEIARLDTEIDKLSDLQNGLRLTLRHFQDRDEPVVKLQPVVSTKALAKRKRGVSKGTVRGPYKKNKLNLGGLTVAETLRRLFNNGSGPMRASDAAKIIGCSRQIVYQSLKHLAKIGFLVKSDGVFVKAVVATKLPNAAQDSSDGLEQHEAAMPEDQQAELNAAHAALPTYAEVAAGRLGS